VTRGGESCEEDPLVCGGTTPRRASGFAAAAAAASGFGRGSRDVFFRLRQHRMSSVRTTAPPTTIPAISAPEAARVDFDFDEMKADDGVEPADEEVRLVVKPDDEDLKLDDEGVEPDGDDVNPDADEVNPELAVGDDDDVRVDDDEVRPTGGNVVGVDDDDVELDASVEVYST